MPFQDDFHKFINDSLNVIGSRDENKSPKNYAIDGSGSIVIGSRYGVYKFADVPFRLISDLDIYVVSSQFNVTSSETFTAINLKAKLRSSGFDIEPTNDGLNGGSIERFIMVRGRNRLEIQILPNNLSFLKPIPLRPYLDNDRQDNQISLKNPFDIVGFKIARILRSIDENKEAKVSDVVDLAYLMAGKFADERPIIVPQEDMPVISLLTCLYGASLGLEGRDFSERLTDYQEYLTPGRSDFADNLLVSTRRLLGQAKTTILPKVVDSILASVRELVYQVSYQYQCQPAYHELMETITEPVDAQRDVENKLRQIIKGKFSDINRAYPGLDQRVIDHPNISSALDRNCL